MRYLILMLYNTNSKQINSNFLDWPLAIHANISPPQPGGLMYETYYDEYIDYRALKELAKEEMERRG